MAKDWKNVLGGIAPTIAAALGGPVAGGAVKFLADKFLGDEKAGEHDLAEAIAGASPQDLAELRRIDAEYKIAMEKAGVDVFKLETQDRANAREMATKTSLIPQMVLSVIYIVGYFTLIYLLLFGDAEIKQSVGDLAKVLIGVMTTAIPMILQFWFGSSHGSKNKDREKTQ